MCKALSACFPHGCTDGSNLGIACEDAESGALTCICSQLEIQGDKWVGMIDIRYPICTTKEAIFQQVQKRLQEAGCSCKVLIQNDPHVVPKESPFVQTLLRIYEEETEKRANALPLVAVLMCMIFRAVLHSGQSSQTGTIICMVMMNLFRLNT